MVALVATSWHGCTPSPTPGQLHQATEECEESAPCDTGNQCVPGTCIDGVCTPGTPLMNGTNCSDGDVCTVDDHCDDGGCVGTPVIDSTGTTWCQQLPPGADWHDTMWAAGPGSAFDNKIRLGMGSVEQRLGNAVEACPPLQQATIDAVFKAAREDRWISEPNSRVNRNGNTNRRTSFFYPPRGCETRADTMAYHVRGTTLLGKLFVWQGPVPGGKLVITNADVKGGYLEWGWHVAPCYRDMGGTVWVIDPSIERNNPIKANDWVFKMAISLPDIEVAACLTGAYTPASACNTAALLPMAWESQFTANQLNLFDLEWINIGNMNRVPQDVLTTLPTGWAPLPMP